MDFLHSSETDVAYYIWDLANKPIFFKDLILEVIEKKRKPVQSLSASISEVYTLINMDARFQHTGNGMWGLVEWNPPETKRSSVSSSSSSASKMKAMSNRRRTSLLEGIQDDTDKA